MSKKQFSTAKTLLFTVVMLTMPLGMTFTLFEAYVRVSYKNIDLYALTGRTIGRNPIADWAVLDAFSAYRGIPGRYGLGKTVNSYGFISTPEIAVAKPEGTLRIAFLGGSSTAGTGRNLADEQTWPWQTVELLRERTGRSIDFINAALSGYSSFESYGRLWSRIRHFSPDIVIVYHGWNEMYYFDEVDRIESWRTLSDGSWSLNRAVAKTTQYAPSAIDPLIKWSQVFIRARLLLATPVAGEIGINKKDIPLSRSFDTRGLAIFRDNLRLIKAATEIMDAKLFVAKQATLVVPGLAPAERERCEYRYHGFDHDAHVQAFDDIYAIIDKLVSADSIIDTTQHSGVAAYFHDHIHPTREGASVIAQTMADKLEKFVDESDVIR